MDTNDMVNTPVDEQRENSALTMWNKFSANTRKAVVDAVSEHWSVLNNEMGGDEFQEQVATLTIGRDMAMEQLENSQQSGDERRIAISQKMLDEQETALDDAYKGSSATVDMTTGMVKLFADMLPLCLEEANVNGVSDLFRVGMRFNVTTGEDSTEVVPVKQSTGRQNGTKDRAERTLERPTKSCDFIVIYEQDNVEPIKEIRKGDFGVTALVGATIFMSDRVGRPHGCTFADGNYAMPGPDASLKDLPWVRSNGGGVSGQTDLLAELVVDSGLVVEGYKADELVYRFQPNGDGGLIAVDADGNPFRTKSLRENNKLVLVD